MSDKLEKDLGPLLHKGKKMLVMPSLILHWAILTMSWSTWSIFPSYRQKLELCNPVLTTLRKWSNGGSLGVSGVINVTGSSELPTTVNEYTGTVASYISFHVDRCVPKCTRGAITMTKPCSYPYSDSWDSGSRRCSRVGTRQSQST